MKKVSLLLNILILWLSMSHIAGAQMRDNNQSLLNIKEQSMIKIAALTAIGDLNQLMSALNEALEHGMTINEINDELVQLYAYSGFPRSLNGINTFITVLAERKAAGKVDIQGRAASPIKDDRDRYARGKAVLEVLINGRDLGKEGGVGLFNPQIETFLKEHLFADIFDSDLFTYKERELATISALAAQSGLEPMLYSHINIGLNLRVTKAQMQELIQMIGTLINPTQADVAAKVLESVELSRQQWVK